jgi:hypothetical protein
LDEPAAARRCLERRSEGVERLLVAIPQRPNQAVVSGDVPCDPGRGAVGRDRDGGLMVVEFERAGDERLSRVLLK